MVKAMFNGDADNTSYQCSEFNANSGNTVSMSNECWDTVIADGKQNLFTIINQNDTEFPTQTTIG